MQCFLRRAARSDDSGSTLIEVVAAAAILTVLVLGLSNLWTTVGGLTFSQILRQKAVFVLNGEMERLDALYASTNFGAGTRLSTQNYPVIANISNSGTRLVYDTTSSNASFVVTSVSALQASNSAVWEAGSGSSARNYVWLDQDRGIVARLSWMETPLMQCGAAAGHSAFSCFCYGFSGFGASACPEIILVIDYPYIIQGGTAVAMPNQNLKTLTLSTIVGRRE